MKYELSHDRLANQIYDKASVELKARRRVQQLVERSLLRYRERRILLTQDDLDEIRPFEEVINFSDEQRDFIQKSKYAILRSRRWRQALIAGVIFTLSLLLAVALWQSSVARKNAQKEKNAAAALALEKDNVQSAYDSLSIVLEKLDLALKDAREQRDTARINEILAQKAQSEAERFSLSLSQKNDSLRVVLADLDAAIREANQQRDTAHLRTLQAQKAEVVAVQEKENAQYQFKIAEIRRVTMLSVLETKKGNYKDAINLAQHALKICDESPELESLVLPALYEFDGIRQILSLQTQINDDFSHPRPPEPSSITPYAIDDIQIRPPEFSPKGNSIISYTPDSTKIWSINGRLIAKFPGQSGVLFSPDDEFFLRFEKSEDEPASAKSTTPELWDVNRGLITKFDHYGAIAEFSTSGNHILTYSGESVKLWSKQGQSLNDFKGVNPIDLSGNQKPSFSPLGNFILIPRSRSRKTGHFYYPDRFVELWDIKGNLLTTMENEGRVLFSPDEKYLSFCQFQGNCRVLDTKGKLLTTLTAGDEMKFSPDGKLMLNYGKGSVKVWDINGSLVRTLLSKKRNRYGPDLTPVFSPDSKKVVIPDMFLDESNNENGLHHVVICDIYPGKAKKNIIYYLTRHAESIQFSSSGEYLLINQNFLVSSKEESIIHDNIEEEIYLTPDDDYFLSFQKAGIAIGGKVLFPSSFNAFDLKGELLVDLAFYFDELNTQAPIRSIAISPNGNLLLIGTDKGISVLKWEQMLKEEVLQTSYYHPGGFPIYSSDGSLIVIIPRRPSLRINSPTMLWNTKENSFSNLGVNHRDAYFYNNDQIIATFPNMPEQPVKLWDIHGNFIADIGFMGKDGYIGANTDDLYFSPDGNRILTNCSSDEGLFYSRGVTRMWDPKGQLILDLGKHFRYAKFSPDSEYIIFLGENVQLRDKNGQLLREYQQKGCSLAQILPKKNRILLYCDLSNDVHILDMNMAQIAKIQNVRDPSFSPDGRSILAFDKGRWSFKLWDLDGKLLADLRQRIKPEFSTSGNLLFDLNKGSSPKFWNANGKLLYAMPEDSILQSNINTVWLNSKTGKKSYWSFWKLNATGKSILFDKKPDEQYNLQEKDLIFQDLFSRSNKEIGQMSDSDSDYLIEYSELYRRSLPENLQSFPLTDLAKAGLIIKFDRNTNVFELEYSFGNLINSFRDEYPLTCSPDGKFLLTINEQGDKLKILRIKDLKWLKNFKMSSLSETDKKKYEIGNYQTNH